jgi:uncharacterized membrane protein
MEENTEQIQEKTKWIAKKEVFDELKKSIESQLFQDSFPRFIRTKKFQDILRRNLGNPKICQLNQTYYYPYTSNF